MDKELTAEALKVTVGLNSNLVGLVRDPKSFAQDLYGDITDLRHLMEMGRTVADQESHNIERLTSDPEINSLIHRYKKMSEDGTYEKMNKEAAKILHGYENRPLAGFKPGDKISWSTNPKNEKFMEEGS